MNSRKILIAKIGGKSVEASFMLGQKDVLVFGHEGNSWNVDDNVWLDYRSELLPDLEDVNHHRIENHKTSPKTDPSQVNVSSFQYFFYGV